MRKIPGVTFSAPKIGKKLPPGSDSHELPVCLQAETAGLAGSIISYFVIFLRSLEIKFPLKYVSLVFSFQTLNFQMVFRILDAPGSVLPGGNPERGGGMDPSSLGNLVTSQSSLSPTHSAVYFSLFQEDHIRFR